jgi:hypothetical protein
VKKANPGQDRVMFEYFFRQVDENHKGQIHDIQLKQFLHSNPLIMDLFSIG